MNETESPSLVTYGSLVLSVVALLMSAYAFWKSEFYDPELVFTTGESLNVGHFAGAGNAYVVLPLVTLNRDSEPQVVDRVALRIAPPSGSGEHLFEPFYYQRLSPTGAFVSESPPEPILVEGNGMALKYVMFRSSMQQPFQFGKPGVYRASVLSWTRGSEAPAVSHTFQFRVDQAAVDTVTKTSSTVRIPLGKYEQWTAGPAGGATR